MGDRNWTEKADRVGGGEKNLKSGGAGTGTGIGIGTAARAGSRKFSGPSTRKQSKNGHG